MSQRLRCVRNDKSHWPIALQRFYQLGDWQLNIPTPAAPNQLQLLSVADQLTINEWMARPTSGDDWLELYNAATFPVSLGGLHLNSGA